MKRENKLVVLQGLKKECTLKATGATTLLDIGYYTSEADVRGGVVKRAFYSMQDGVDINKAGLKFLRQQASLSSVAYDMLSEACARLLGEIE